MRGSNISNVGAHADEFLAAAERAPGSCPSIYRMPAACSGPAAVLSNTVPTDPYRSAGRPEVMFVMERLIDLACA